jgi:hypothetical protein
LLFAARVAQLHPEVTWFEGGVSLGTGGGGKYVSCAARMGH